MQPLYFQYLTIIRQGGVNIAECFTETKSTGNIQQYLLSLR